MQFLFLKARLMGLNGSSPRAVHFSVRVRCRVCACIKVIWTVLCLPL